MSAWNCMSSSFTTMPPSTFSEVSSTPESAFMASTTSLDCHAVASSTARAMWPALTYLVRPAITPRASLRQYGANSPEKAGTKYTPPLSSTVLASVSTSAEVETLARTVEDNGGVYFVPAFSGLFAPYWRSDARGVIAGLTRYVNSGHIARAVLEATAWQSKEVVDAMNADSGVALTSLKVDGGMVVNELLMQFQADVLGVPVSKPVVAETTALGAAYAAG